MCVIIVSVLSVYFAFKIRRMNRTLNEVRNLIEELQDDLADVEDGNVKLHRSTQIMIMNICQKLGVVIDAENCQFRKK
jgi:cell division protein FtsL